VSGERVRQVMEHIWKLQEFCNSMIKVETDDYEYAYLKAIVLFSPGECSRSRREDEERSLGLTCCVVLWSFIHSFIHSWR